MYVLNYLFIFYLWNIGGESSSCDGRSWGLQYNGQSSVGERKVRTFIGERTRNKIVKRTMNTKMVDTHVDIWCVELKLTKT